MILSYSIDYIKAHKRITTIYTSKDKSKLKIVVLEKFLLDDSIETKTYVIKKDLNLKILLAEYKDIAYNQIEKYLN